MKNIEIITATIALVMLLGSCGSAKNDLLNPGSRNEIMTAIANDRAMSNEMMTTMMNGPNGKMMMQENQHMKMMMSDKGMMTDMVKNNPEMMQSMMSNMLESAKGDTSMMSEMCKMVMANQPMMNMMQTKNGQGMNMKNMHGM